MASRLSGDDQVSEVRKARSIRVFVSSTFSDMRAERDVLIKHTFPELRNQCEKRGVSFTEVDLRWGITNEQRSEGRVLPICLEEIDNARPFFICILGERYGWVPDQLDPVALRQAPWLAHYPGCSVTELEVRHGALNNAGMQGHAFFYFREPQYVNSLSQQRRSDFLEVPSAVELHELGTQEAERRAAERRDRLAALKSEIMASGFTVQVYASPGAVGDLVARDLGAVVDELFPRDEAPETERERARRNQQNYARQQSAFHVVRSVVQRTLDAHVLRDGPPLVLFGSAGTGKSASLAHWLSAQREVPVVFHLGDAPNREPFLGEPIWLGLVRRVTGELSEALGLAVEAPETSAQFFARLVREVGFGDARQEIAPALEQFRRCLEFIETKPVRIVLVLDGLDSIDSGAEFGPLWWLPARFPSNLRLILGLRPGRLLDEAKARGWQLASMPPLARAERAELGRTYLSMHAKRLSGAQEERIYGAGPTAVPRYLRVLLEEIRLSGEHSSLDRRIDSYLDAASTPELYDRVLERLEEDFENERPGLVRDALGTLVCRPTGAARSWLCALLGDGEVPLPYRLLSPVLLALSTSLLEHEGNVTIADPELRAAIERRYLADRTVHRAFHQRIADSLAGASERSALEEFPWQLEQAEDWDELHGLLADPEELERQWSWRPRVVERFWARLEAKTGQRVVHTYGALDPQSRGRTLEIAAALLDTLGHKRDAVDLRTRLQRVQTPDDTPTQLRRRRNNEALLMRYKGQALEAMERLLELAQECRGAGDKAVLQSSLGNAALIAYADRGQPDVALELHAEEEILCRELGASNELAGCLYNQALIFKACARPAAALARLSEHEQLARELQDRGLLATSLGLRALVVQDLGDPLRALELHGEEQALLEQLGDVPALARCLANQALAQRALGHFVEAMALLMRAQGLFESLRDWNGLYLAARHRATSLRMLARTTPGSVPSAAIDEVASMLQETAAVLAREGATEVSRKLEMTVLEVLECRASAVEPDPSSRTPSSFTQRVRGGSGENS